LNTATAGVDGIGGRVDRSPELHGLPAQGSAAYTNHRLHPQHTFANTRQVRLHGVYAWQVCLLRYNDGPYVVWAQLRNLATGGKARIDHKEWGGVYYDWGTTLANVRG
jgi:hypothetical protein